MSVCVQWQCCYGSAMSIIELGSASIEYNSLIIIHPVLTKNGIEKKLGKKRKAHTAFINCIYFHDILKLT